MVTRQIQRALHRLAGGSTAKVGDTRSTGQVHPPRTHTPPRAHAHRTNAHRTPCMHSPTPPTSTTQGCAHAHSLRLNRGSRGSVIPPPARRRGNCTPVALGGARTQCAAPSIGATCRGGPVGQTPTAELSDTENGGAQGARTQTTPPRTRAGPHWQSCPQPTPIGRRTSAEVASASSLGLPRAHLPPHTPV